jgi:hypothetical protein
MPRKPDPPPESEPPASATAVAEAPPANTTASDLIDPDRLPPASDAPPEETVEPGPPANLNLTLQARGKVVAWAPKTTDTGTVLRITFETADIAGEDLELLWCGQQYPVDMMLTFAGRSQRMTFGVGATESAFAEKGEARQPEGYPEGEQANPAAPRRCRDCGCTDDLACPGGCTWVEPDLCSRCAGQEPPLHEAPNRPPEARDEP